MSGLARRPRPLNSQEREIVSHAFGFPHWRDMVAVFADPVRRGSDTSTTAVSRIVISIGFVPRARRRAWVPTSRTRVPSAAAIVAACSQVKVPVTDGEILNAVRGLAKLAMHEHTMDPHEPVSPTQVAFEHDQLTATLDLLTNRALPSRSRRRAAVHTESLTDVIDRLVTFAVTRAVIDPHPATTESRQLDTALTDLMAAYDQLVTDLVTGHRRLPRYQSVPAT